MSRHIVYFKLSNGSNLEWRYGLSHWSLRSGYTLSSSKEELILQDKILAKTQSQYVLTIKEEYGQASILVSRRRL